MEEATLRINREESKYHLYYNGEQKGFHFDPIDALDKPHFTWKLLRANLEESKCSKFCDLMDDRYGYDCLPSVTVVREEFEYFIEHNQLTAKAFSTATTSSTLGVGSRFEILKRDGFRCQLCGASASDGVRLEVDHKHPKSKGGSNDESNLWTLCFGCNRGKAAKLIQLHASA